jgi:mono/diheme cytochrome c family protein
MSRRVAAAVAFTLAVAATGATLRAQDAAALVATHCAECHSGPDATRGFDATALFAAPTNDATETAAAARRERAQQALLRVRSHTMPPPLVPKPRKHLVTYHGVLASASGLRPKVVPRQLVEEGEAGGCGHGATEGVDGAESAEGVATDGVENVAAAAFLRQQAERRVRARLRVPHGGGRRRGGRRRYSWAELLQRTFGIEVLVCPKCCGVRRVLAAIHDPASIARVLGAMGLSSAVPEQAGCRSPPAWEGVADIGEGTAW